MVERSNGTLKSIHLDDAQFRAQVRAKQATKREQRGGFAYRLYKEKP